MRKTTVPAILDTLGGRLQYYRENAGLTREDVGVYLGRGAGAIRDWESNQRPPKHVLLVQLARLYGVSVTELIGTDSVAPR